MEVYVDELPKGCCDCPCRNISGDMCRLIEKEHNLLYFDDSKNEYFANPHTKSFKAIPCPLKSLADFEKQVRDDELTKLFYLVEEIYKTNEMDKMWLIDYIKSRIYQIKGEK